MCRRSYLSSAVVEVSVVRPPWFETLPAKAMVTLAFHAEREEKSNENFADYATVQQHTVGILHSSRSVCYSWGTSLLSCWRAAWTGHPRPCQHKTLQPPPTYECLHSWPAHEPTDTHTVLNQHSFSNHPSLFPLTSVNIHEKHDVHAHLWQAPVLTPSPLLRIWLQP